MKIEEFENLIKNAKKKDTFYIEYTEDNHSIDRVISKIIEINSEFIYFDDIYTISGISDNYWSISRNSLIFIKFIKKLKYKQIKAIKKHYPQLFL